MKITVKRIQIYSSPRTILGTYEFQVTKETVIDTIFEQLASQTGHYPSDIRLIHGGKQLDRSRTIGDYFNSALYESEIMMIEPKTYRQHKSKLRAAENYIRPQIKDEDIDIKSLVIGAVITLMVAGVCKGLRR